MLTTACSGADTSSSSGFSHAASTAPWNAGCSVTIVSTSPGKQKVENMVSPPIGRSATAPQVFGSTEQVPPPPPKPPAENRADLLLLLEKGRENVRLGNVQIARQFYQRAAEKGLAEAAFALAITYDPQELARMKGVAGVLPDIRLAKKWYEKARELGSPEAAARLSALERQ